MPTLTLSELLDYFPSSAQINSEIHTACPFCRPEPQVVYHKGRAFYGEDRLIWFPDGVWCRKCRTYMRLDDLAREFDPSADFDLSKVEDSRGQKVVRDAPAGVSEAFIDAMHKHVQRDYWYAFGWTDETIDHFRLGFGPVSSWAKTGERHLIPFKVRSLEFDAKVWAMEGRSTDPEQIAAGKKNVKTPGIQGRIFSYIHEGPNRSIAICEGAKDAVSLYQLGFRHILMLPGTSVWSDDLGSWLKTKGYDRVEIYGDNDEAGRKLAEEIGTCFRNDLIEAVYFQWPSKYRDGYDVTDLLARLGQDETVRELRRGLKTAPLLGFVNDFTTVEPTYTPTFPIKAKHVNQIRQELPTVIDEYINNYAAIKKSYKRPVIKVLASPPGSGKSYQMVRAAQDVAQRMLADRLEKRQRIEKLIAQLDDPEEIEQQERELSRLPMGQVVLYAGPFRAGWDDIINQPCYDEGMWYFFDSRNEDNCGNYQTAGALGAKGYNVLSYCKTMCPLREECAKSGYLRQFDEILDYPIAYVRHQHLMDKELLGRYRVLMVDENPLKVIEGKIRIHARDLKPSVDSWKDYAIPGEADALDDLILMLRRVLNDSMSEYISYTGKEFWDRLSQVGDLPNVMKRVTVDGSEHFQPRMPLLTDKDTVHGLPGRKVPQLVELMLAEYPKYQSGEQFNSQISLVNRSIEFYCIEKVPISRNKPVVVSDGTPFVELYGAAFKREVEVYDPDVYSELAQTVVLTGKDYTMRSFLKSTKYLRTDEELEPLEDDEEAELSEPQGETDFRSREIRDIYNLLKYLEPDHERILFITMKERERLIAEQIVNNYPDMNVEFNHYGNVRGSNAYKDCDAVVVWGAYREPYTAVYRRVQAWASYMGIDRFIPYRIIHRGAPYHGRWEGHSYITFEDEFADRFIQMIEAGEVIQSMDRIRPHTSGVPKTVYVVMSRPVAPWITKLMFSNSTFKRISTEMDDELMTALSDYYWDAGKLPTYRKASKTFRMSNQKLQEAYEVWESEQISEVDENVEKALLSIGKQSSMDITYSVLSDDLDVNWRYCKVLKEKLDDNTAAERLSAG